ncbi:MAG TPA: transporter [Cyanobacteria bacterium UBA12227]|nr:transporter [Cyanobacteria bacterium UBA12227]HAX86815.1 transporter [Cyanobacteria bacterium UBA11370]HBY78364.1 transporter [Cyanobacteria bacterium UBA11148]
MSGLVTAIPTGITAFTATNLDDLVILTMFFSQINHTFRRRHIVIGQYLGFSALLIASLPGFFGGLILPQHWIGLLGLVPIGIGLSRLFNSDTDSLEDVEDETGKSNSSPLTSFLSPQTYGVAAITIANGSDNISIYVPLFASSGLERLLVILTIFLLLVGVWCYITYKLTCQPAIADTLTRYGNTLVPFVLIGLGIFIILESQALTPLALAASCLCLMGLIKMNGRLLEVEKN